MNEIIVSPQVTSFCYVDDSNNMIDITDDVPYRLIQFVKRMKFIDIYASGDPAIWKMVE